MLTLHLTLIRNVTLTLILTLTLTLSERNAYLWRPVNYNLAELSGHIGTSAEVEVSYGHFGSRKTIRHRATLYQAMARRTAVLA